MNPRFRSLRDVARTGGQAFACLAAITLLWPRPAQAGEKWQGAIPKIAENNTKWSELVDKLAEEKMYYGELAAAGRMLMFFSDLPSKEKAYKTIINLVDVGYPFSAKAYFSTGDIEPSDDPDFVNSYNLYKAIISQDKGLQQWADHYFNNVDKEKFPKYLLYAAMESYAKGDLDSAEKSLKKILAQPLAMDQQSLVKKTARTLARIYFEREQYDKSLDVYKNFLLRVMPITPSDWLEAAWDYYYLKKYDHALGLLFNLEAKSAAGLVDLEKYELRALIYQGLCDTSRMQLLTKTFDDDFGTTITAIKSGENLSRLPALKTLYHPSNAAYFQNLTTLEQLQQESEQVTSLSGSMRELAHYLYTSEINMQKRKLNSYTEAALTNAATHLITLSENLRFLKFDVSREQYNPESIFQQAERKPGSYAKKGPGGEFTVHWMQMGDYWRDERNDYKARIKNRCEEAANTPPTANPGSMDSPPAKE